MLIVYSKSRIMRLVERLIDFSDVANLTDEKIEQDLPTGGLFRDLYCDDYASLAKQLVHIHKYSCVDFSVLTGNQKLKNEIKKELDANGIESDLIFKNVFWKVIKMRKKQKKIKNKARDSRRIRTLILG